MGHHGALSIGVGKETGQGKAPMVGARREDELLKNINDHAKITLAKKDNKNNYFC
jgi:hypothetical protein